MLSAEQLKGKVKQIAKDRNLKAQEVLQMYLFERLLVRIEKSKYQANFIIKGGFLIASMIGIQSRTMMDLDSTINGIGLHYDSINIIISEIICLEVDDKINFECARISRICQDDIYENFRVHLVAVFGKIRAPLKIDITTGGLIIPAPENYSYSMMFENKVLNIKAYALETVIAEKYETVISKNIHTTRIRDFYDIYILLHVKKKQLRVSLLKEAVKNIALSRGSIKYIYDWRNIIEDIRNNESLKQMWIVFLKDNSYTKFIDFTKVVSYIYIIGTLIKIEK